MSRYLFRITRFENSKPVIAGLNTHKSQDNNKVERTWAPEGVTCEKRNVLSRKNALSLSLSSLFFFFSYIDCGTNKSMSRP